jgi:hypothetical protein
MEEVVIEETKISAISCAIAIENNAGIDNLRIAHCSSEGIYIGFGLQVGTIFSPGSIKVNNALILGNEIKGVIPLFMPRIEGRFYVSNNLLESMGYSAHDNSLGMFISNFEGSSVVANQNTIAIHAPTPSAVYDDNGNILHYTQLRTAIALGASPPGDFGLPPLGISAHNIEIKNTTVTGTVDCILNVKNVHDCSFKNTDYTDAIIEDHKIITHFFGDVISGYHYVLESDMYGNTSTDNILKDNARIVPGIYDETDSDNTDPGGIGYCYDGLNILRGKLKKLYCE